jgi:hypothetical protein
VAIYVRFAATAKKTPDDVIEKSAIQLPSYNYGFLAIVCLAVGVGKERMRRTS